MSTFWYIFGVAFGFLCGVIVAVMKNYSPPEWWSNAEECEFNVESRPATYRTPAEVHFVAFFKRSSGIVKRTLRFTPKDARKFVAKFTDHLQRLGEAEEP